jgi:hydroxypyruvate isomerase
LSFAADAVGHIGGVVLVEPLTWGENGPYPLLTSSEVLGVVANVQSSTRIGNVAMLADLYHLARNGEDVERVIVDCIASIGHVQLADVPRRGAPGTGVMETERVLALLDESKFGGHIGLEYRYEGPSAASFEWLPRAAQESTRATGVDD